MSDFLKAVFFVLTVGAGCATGPEANPAGSPEPATMAFVNVALLTLDSDEALAGQTVVIQGDRIVSVGPAASAAVPAEAVRIDGREKFLMPGLGEMHGHIPPPTEDRQYVEDVLFLYVANGVTTVRGMLGWPGQLQLRQEANQGAVVAPTLYLAGPSFNGQSINSPEEAILKVQEQKAEGWDLLKVHPGLTLEEYDAMADTANAVGIRFAGHVPAEVGLLHALERRQETIDHLDGYIEHLSGGDQNAVISEAQYADIARRTREHGVAVVPTMALWETILGAADLEKMRGYPELAYMPERQVANWTQAYQRRLENSEISAETAKKIAEARKRLLKALNDGGVQILLGTDAPQLFSVPGFSIHREVPLMLESGMTPLEILRSGSLNVGEYFKSKDQFGQIAPGHRADLILLEANPLEDLANLKRRAGVMVRGRWLPESEIQERLERIKSR